MEPATARVLILGGGVAGVAAARALTAHSGRTHAQITVLDASPYLTYHSWLYEVATAAAEEEITERELFRVAAIPREELEDTFPDGSVQLLQEEIVDVDCAAKAVRCASGRIFRGDALVYALGSVPNDFLIPGVRENAIALKSLHDAARIHARLQELFRRASFGAPVRIAVGGGGFSGVEIAAELANYVRKLERTRVLPKGKVHITIVEARQRLLPALPEAIHTRAAYRLRALGVSLRLGAIIHHVGKDRFALASGEQERHDLFVWAGGVKPHPLAARVQGFPLNVHGAIQVEPSLAVRGLRGVFALGDAVDCGLPATAQIATKQGRGVARNIAAYLAGETLVPVEVKHEGFIIPLGGKYAIAAFPNFTFAGFFGWLVRKAADFRYLRSVLPFRDALQRFRFSLRTFSKND